MTTLEAAKEQSRINKDELRQITDIMFETLNGKDLNHSSVTKKEQTIDFFTHTIEQYLKLNFSGSKEQKVQLIKFVSKLNIQKELLELEAGLTNVTDIFEAGKRLGKKSQSAFEKK
jgi:thiamine kinase-like enzyme